MCARRQVSKWSFFCGRLLGTLLIIGLVIALDELFALFCKWSTLGVERTVCCHVEGVMRSLAST